MKKRGLMLVLPMLLVAIFSTNALAANLDDGVWSYGSHREIGNWGAFSNYWHPYEKHWSEVVSKKNSNSSWDKAGPHDTSRAFINTSIGEQVNFYRGFLK